MRAIEEGILTPTTKARMNELENSLADINIKISAEEVKLERTLKKSDVECYIIDALNSDAKTLIEILVEKVTLYEDKIEISFRYSKNTNPDELLDGAIGICVFYEYKNVVSLRVLSEYVASFFNHYLFTVNYNCGFYGSSNFISYLSVLVIPFGGYHTSWGFNGSAQMLQLVSWMWMDYNLLKARLFLNCLNTAGNTVNPIGNAAERVMVKGVHITGPELALVVQTVPMLPNRGSTLLNRV